MRDYGKVTPNFWIGETGKLLRGHPEAQVVALYLVTGPHANMIGLYYLPMAYLIHETGLGEQGASKGLARAIEGGFCRYDYTSEVVFVPRMAFFQIAPSLSPKDKRCEGVQNTYDATPVNIFLEEFYDLYAEAFHLKTKRKIQLKKPSPSEAPSKPLGSQEQEQEQEQEQKQEQDQLPGLNANETLDTATGEVLDKPPTPKRQRRVFIAPTLAEVIAEGARIMLPKEECEGFLDHHEARGWVSKGSKIVDWRRALNTWNRNYRAKTFSRGVANGKAKHAGGFDQVAAIPVLGGGGEEVGT